MLYPHPLPEQVCERDEDILSVKSSQGVSPSEESLESLKSICDPAPHHFQKPTKVDLCDQVTQTNCSPTPRGEECLDALQDTQHHIASQD